MAVVKVEGHMKEIDTTGFGDAGYRWNDNILPDMCHEEQCEHLLSSAREAMSFSEWDVAYQILRELVWRAPRWDAEPWHLLSKCGAMLGKMEEASKATKNFAILKESKHPHHA
jgi:hypothetical protein